MLDAYNQTLQDQIGQLSKLLGVQQSKTAAAVPENISQNANRYDCVDGLEGARTFLKQRMLPGAKHIVWDSNADIFYGLELDANGNPARIKICHYTVEMEPTMEDLYVKKDDFDALVSKIDQLINSSNKEVKKNG